MNRNIGRITLKVIGWIMVFIPLGAVFYALYYLGGMQFALALCGGALLFLLYTVISMSFITLDTADDDVTRKLEALDEKIESFYQEAVLAVETSKEALDGLSVIREALKNHHHGIDLEPLITSDNKQNLEIHSLWREVSNINNILLRNIKSSDKGNTEEKVVKKLTRREEIAKWRKENPEKTRTDCFNETKIPKSTINKYWGDK